MPVEVFRVSTDDVCLVACAANALDLVLDLGERLDESLLMVRQA